MLNALLSSSGVNCWAYGRGVVCKRLLDALAVCHRHAQSKPRCLPTCVGTADWARVVFYEALFEPLLHPGQALLGICLVLYCPGLFSQHEAPLIDLLVWDLKVLLFHAQCVMLKHRLYRQ